MTIADPVLLGVGSALAAVAFVAWTAAMIGLGRAHRSAPEPAESDSGRAVPLGVATVLVTFLAASLAEPHVGRAAWLVLIAVAVTVYSWCLYRAG